MASRQVDVFIEYTGDYMPWVTCDADKVSKIAALEGIERVTHMYGRTYCVQIDKRYIEAEVEHDIIVACSGELPEAYG